MKSYDVIVLGAGIAGLSVARELAKLKQRVLVLERDDPGGKASKAAAGILDPYSEINTDTPLLGLGLKGLEFYASFLEEIKEAVRTDFEFKKLGILYLALTPEDERVLEERFEWQKKKGFPVESFSAREVLEKEPGVSQRVRGGVYYPEIPKLHAEKLTSALFKAAQAAGVEIRTLVKKVSVWIEGERIRGVKTPEGPIGSPVVVQATGCWTGLNEKLGIKVKVTPVRGQILLLRAKSSFYPRHILHTIRWAYIVPWPAERLLIGSTLESAGFEDQVTPDGKKDILDRVSEMVEGIRELPIEASWSGLRPYIEGGMPLIGPTRIGGLFLATGYYRSGILIGPLVGKLLAEGIVSDKFSSWLEPFYPKEKSTTWKGNSL